jgi:hypothetical protein
MWAALYIGERFYAALIAVILMYVIGAFYHSVL